LGNNGERKNGRKEYWNNGMMEDWNDGCYIPIIPTFQYSIFKCGYRKDGMS
jgi:hypothetical protein